MSVLTLVLLGLLTIYVAHHKVVIRDLQKKLEIYDSGEEFLFAELEKLKDDMMVLDAELAELTEELE